MPRLPLTLTLLLCVTCALRATSGLAQDAASSSAKPGAASSSDATEAAPAPGAVSKLRVHDAYVRMPPPGVPNAVAFMKVESGDGKPHAIVSVKTAVAKHASLHTHTREGEVMRMAKVARVDVPAQGTVAFQPGGLHVMIMGLTQPLKEGQVLSLVLVLDDGSEQRVEAQVRDARKR